MRYLQLCSSRPPWPCAETATPSDVCEKLITSCEYRTLQSPDTWEASNSMGTSLCWGRWQQLVGLKLGSRGDVCPARVLFPAVILQLHAPPPCSQSLCTAKGAAVHALHVLHELASSNEACIVKLQHYTTAVIRGYQAPCTDTRLTWEVVNHAQHIPTSESRHIAKSAPLLKRRRRGLHGICHAFRTLVPTTLILDCRRTF